MTTQRGGHRGRSQTTVDASRAARHRGRVGASTAVAALLGAVAFSGSVALPAGTADAAPPDLIPPAAGILPGPAAGGETPGSWGPCVPDPDATDNCSGWLIPPGQISTSFPGTDDGPSVIVGGDFTAGLGSAETEGLLVVAGDAEFQKSYNVGVAGGGTGVVPAHRADMLVVGGDTTVLNPSLDPQAGGNPATVGIGLTTTDGASRYGDLHVGGAWNFRDPSYSEASNPGFGRLGDIDSANQDPPAVEQQNVIDSDVSVLDDDHYTDLFGTSGKMSRYSQLCYAELSTTAATSVVNEGGTLSLEHGTVSQDGNSIVLTSDGSGQLVVFDLPAAVGTFGGTGANVQINGVADGATVLINTLAEGEVNQQFADVRWDGADEAAHTRALQRGNTILWNYPFATSVNVGGATQFAGSILVGTPGSTTNLGFSGANGRVYTPGNLEHSGTAFGTNGNEMHGFHFDGALGCAQATPGTFSVAKSLAGDAADQVPDGTTFTVGWEVTGPAGSANHGRTGTLEVAADGTVVNGPTGDDALAAGDEVTFSEPTFPEVEGVDWGDPVISPNPIIIGAENTVAEVSVTNTATLQRGGFTIIKEVTGDDGASTTAFDVAWECSAQNMDGDGSGTVTLGAGESATVDGFPVGTTCTFSEETPTDDNGTWADPTIDPAEITIVDGDPTATVVTVTNTFDVDEPTGGFTIAKEVADDSDAGASTTEFTGAWTCSAPNADGESEGDWALADGDELAVDGFPVGTTCSVTEDDVVDDNGTWSSTIDPEGELTITEGDASAQVVTVTNTFDSTVGAFTITKEVAGDDGGTVDEFTVDWVCTAPDGEETSGSVTLAAGETSEPVGDLPVGTECTITEPEVDDPAGTWVADITPDEITIGSDDPTEVAAVTVTNTFSTEPVGGFTVTKSVDGDVSGATVRDFSGTWTCSSENLAGDASGTWGLADGESLVVDGFPVGTTCEVAEDEVVDDAGTWSSSIEPDGAFTITEEGASATVAAVTNTFTPTAPSPSPSPSASTPAPTPSDSTPAPSTPAPSTGAPAPGTDGGTLPRTGAQVATTVALAALLLGAGAIAMMAARRRS